MKKETTFDQVYTFKGIFAVFCTLETENVTRGHLIVFKGYCYRLVCIEVKLTGQQFQTGHLNKTSTLSLVVRACTELGGLGLPGKRR